MATSRTAPTGRLFQGALAANGRSKLPQATACAGKTLDAGQLAIAVGVAVAAARAGKQAVAISATHREDQTRGHFAEVGIGRSRSEDMGGLHRRRVST